MPSFSPTPLPGSPTQDPTESPTPVPSAQPSESPTFEPSAEPTFEPSAEPTFEPSAEPTFEPSAEPTFEPSAEPTFLPSVAPTVEPSATPSCVPSFSPTPLPGSPTQDTTESPSLVAQPTHIPSFAPTNVGDTNLPTSRPSVFLGQQQPGDDSGVQNLSFFEKLPLYGKWLFSLGICVSVVALLWLGHEKVYIPYYLQKANNNGDENFIEDFDKIGAFDNEESAWGADGVHSPLSSIAPTGVNGDASYHTPLSSRISARNHRFMTPVLPPPPRTENSKIDEGIVAKISTQHLNNSGDGDDDGDDDLVFGY